MPDKHSARHNAGPTSSVLARPTRPLRPVASSSDARANLREQTPLVSASSPQVYRSSNSRNATKFTSRTNEPRPSRGYETAKRMFDLVLGTVLLLIALPLIAVAACAIRLETPGSPFFVQTRLGKGGKPFKLVKLRGMYKDARTRFPAYYEYSARTDLDFFFHHEVDPRVTVMGKFFRRTSIDELPNLWNVVRGDMSLVGPRPEIPEVLAMYGKYREEYLSVKPGVTCVSKCTGRDKLTKRATIEFDLEYIRRRSFADDWKILWRTFRGVVLRRDVF